MQVLVKAKDGFIHGEFRMERGDETVMDESLARDLAHLVDIKTAPRPLNKMMPEPLNKGNVLAAGKDAQSPSSPAAQASPKATAKLLDSGVKKAASEK